MITLHWSILIAICVACFALGFIGAALMASASYIDEKRREIFGDEDKRNG